MTVKLLAGMASLRNRYDAAILDLWGVLHDGVKATPGALHALDSMQAAGWRRVLLSNAPRSIDSVKAQVAGYGIPHDRYDAVVTSGYLTRTALAERADAFHAALGKRFYHLGPDRDHGLLAGLDYEQVQTPERAHFILNTGLFDDETETAADYAGLLQLARHRELPMLCANPDRWVNRGKRLVPCAGVIADAYEAMGGQVAWHGKPHPDAFRACFRHMPGVAAGRVVMVGDSLPTDIRGANSAGLDSILVMDGLHAEEFGGQSPDIARVEAAAAKFGAKPTAVLHQFAW